MIKFPQNGKWSQLNSTDKAGSLAYSKNLNLDQEGYLKLSPRMVSIFSDVDDNDFNVPVAFGRYDDGDFRLTTIEDPFNVGLSNTSLSVVEDETSDNPVHTVNSHGTWWQNRWYASTATTVSYNTAGTWTANAISSLTSGVRHYLEVFKNKNSLAVSNGNTVKLYDTSHSNTVTLTLPSDFEVIGLAYNNNKLGIITRLGTDSLGQNSDAYFFVWDGATTEAGAGFSTGAYSIVAVKAYKSSFVLLSTSGQLLYWNGGGFEEIAALPFYFSDKRWGFLNTLQAYGDIMTVEGDIIYINVIANLTSYGRDGETTDIKSQSGIWCYDPKIGLYHRSGYSISKAYSHTISQANVNTTTDVFTTSGTIPATGSPVVLTNAEVGGLKKGVVYYVIKLTSTTFKLATSRYNAIDLIAIDITSAASSQAFWMYNVVDYSPTLIEKAGGLALFGTENYAYRDFICGATIYNTELNSEQHLMMSVPFLPNRGYGVLSRLFTNAQTENIQSVVIKHSPLDIDDKIILKSKVKNFHEIPKTSPTGATELAWTSSTTATTTTDINEVKTAFDAGEEMEIELTAGLGGGQLIKITNITESNGTYTLTFEEEVIGYSAGLSSYFAIDNWKVCGEINYDNQTEGVMEIPVAENGKAPQFKIELRGVGTAIEDIQIINKPHKP